METPKDELVQENQSSTSAVELPGNIRQDNFSKVFYQSKSPPVVLKGMPQVLVPRRSVYINKKILDIKQNKRKNEKRVIYCNPKFIKPSLPVESGISLPSRVREIKESIPKIHVNPKFLPSSVSSTSFREDIKRTEKVFVNPAFLNRISQASGCSPLPVQSKKIQQHIIVNEFTPKDSNQTNFISKYSLSRIQPAVTQPTKVPEIEVCKKNIYKLVNKKRRKSVTEVTPLTQVEFKKTKYTLRRKRGIPVNINGLVCKKRKSSESGGSIVKRGNTSELSGLSRSQKSSMTSDTDPLKRLSRTKLVRTSILKAMIEARRCPTKLLMKSLFPNRGALALNRTNGRNPRKRIVSESKRSRRKSLKSRYKIVHKSGEKPVQHSPPIRKKQKRKKASLVCIEGTIYRSTPHKLTRRTEAKGGRVVSIQGVNYRINKGAKSLRKLDKISAPGSTPAIISCANNFSSKHYLSKSLIRYETTSKMVLRSARKRSIMILTAKLRKHNIPCTFFIRFGYCKGTASGKCHKLHDRKLVSLCKKYLRGNCKSDDCLLSHNPIPEKMPLCEYYLSGGHCLVDDCPYLHVNHGPNAPICRLFLKGFCPSGVNCSKRHEFVCPMWVQKGACPRRSRCPYPHPRKYDMKQKTIPTKGTTNGRRKLVLVNPPPLGEKSKERIDKDKDPVEVSRERYFRLDLNESESPTASKDPGQDEEDSTDASVGISNDVINIDDSLEFEEIKKLPFPKLPDFLPLS